nr:ATP-dependent Clp protease proteolytic subunit [Mitsuokella multacida]
MLKTFDIYYDISPLYLDALDKHLRSCAADKEINLNICSPGGDIYAGIAIAEKLRACGKRVNARVWGYAASAAFTIACACDFVEASPLTHFMVHSAYGWDGDVDEGCKHANESQLALIHRKNADYTEKDLSEDRWFTASEAQAFGLVDRIVEFDGDAEAKRAAAYGFSKFRNIGGDTMKAEEMKKEEVIEEKMAEELTPEIVDEKVEDQIEQKVDDKSDDLLEQVIERIEELSARVAALEEKREAECVPNDEKKAKLAARLASISRPVERVVATEEEKTAQNAAKDLERFKAVYGTSFDRFIRG